MAEFVYEYFKPMSERKEESENNILFIHLPPEFSKVQIAITCILSSHKIRVQGEREVENQIWWRFDQTYEVPENCTIHIDKIDPKRDDDPRCIIFPKVVRNIIYPLQPPKTQPQESLTSNEEPKLPATPEDEGRSEVSKFKTPPSIPKPEPKQAETQLTHAVVRPSSSRESQKTEEKELNEVSEFETPPLIPKPEPKQNETQLTHPVRPRRSIESQKFEEKGGNEVSEFETLPPSILKPKQKQTEIQTHAADKSSSSRESQKSEGKDRNEVSAFRPTKKAEEKKKKEKTCTSYEKDKESILNKAVDYDDVVANKREEKQLMLTIGVAALVILSIGVYVLYKFGSKLE